MCVCVCVREKREGVRLVCVCEAGLNVEAGLMMGKMVGGVLV